MISTASNNNKVISTIASVLLSIALIIGLQGCSSSSDSVTPVPTQDINGLFNGFGELNAQSLTDLKAIVDANRVMLFSVAANLVIDGTLSVTSDDFTGTVKIYKNGVVADQAATVSGNVTTASSITGTITNSTASNGTFELTFDPLYNREALQSKIETASAGAVSWEGASYSVDISLNQSAMEFDDDTSFFDAVSETCNYNQGEMSIPATQVNIYSLLSITVEEFSSCQSISPVPDDFNGFASLVDTVSAEDTLIAVMTNGLNAVFFILTR